MLLKGCRRRVGRQERKEREKGVLESERAGVWIVP